MADEVKDQAPATTTDAPETTAAPAAPAPQAAAPHAAAPHTGAPQQRPRYGDRGPRPGGDRGPRPGGGREGGPRKFFRRKKVCKFCVEKIDSINYKDVRLLSQFVAERGKIVPRRLTGVCTPHQRRLTAAIKQARNIALLPFAARM
jgi:small subunit ribosomal protein S18